MRLLVVVTRGRQYEAKLESAKFVKVLKVLNDASPRLESLPVVLRSTSVFSSCLTRDLSNFKGDVIFSIRRGSQRVKSVVVDLDYQSSGVTLFYGLYSISTRKISVFCTYISGAGSVR